MNYRMLGWSVVAAGLMMSFQHSYADCGERHHYDWILKLSKKLDLSQEQDHKIKEIAKKYKKMMHENRQHKIDLKLKLNEVFKSYPIDMEKIDHILVDEKDLFIDKEKIKLQERVDVYQVLNQEQRAKFTKRVQDWLEKHKKKFKKHES
jgi:Spy/CpxP family protein refolding chaperone